MQEWLLGGIGTLANNRNPPSRRSEDRLQPVGKRLAAHVRVVGFVRSIVWLAVKADAAIAT